MFDKNAIYFSAYVGEFKGRDKIANMMSEFFARFPDVNWNVEQYQYKGDRTVGFNFVMTATDLKSGEAIKRSAYEQLKFSSQGYIEYLEVTGS